MGEPMTAPTDNDDMPAEIDFSGGVRGRFYRPKAEYRLAVYLDADAQSSLAALAAKKGVPLSELANDLLKKELASLKP